MTVSVAVLLLATCQRQVNAQQESHDDRDAEVQQLVGTAPEPEMPDRIFTPSITKRAKAYVEQGSRYPFFASSQYGNRQRGLQWTALPLETWERVIADHAPVALATCGGQCPFCDKRLEGVSVDLGTPGKGIARCCGATIYAEPEDMPADYVARPNHQLRVPHLDGNTHSYHFHVPAGAKDDKKQWFCAAGELWHARLQALTQAVVPDLTARLLVDEDPDAARTLAAIFDRLADVYQGLPFYNNTVPLGFEQGWEQMTADIYRERLAQWRRPPEFYREGVSDYSKLPAKPSPFESTRVRHCGTLAEAYDLLRHHPVAQTHIKALYGSPTEFDKRVMDRLFGHMNAWLRIQTPFTGNLISPWFTSTIRLALLTGDRDLMKKVAFYFESYLHNHHYSDGLSVEGAFNYSAMIGYLFQTPWISQELLGIDFASLIPRQSRIMELGNDPVITLLGVESMHGDEHAMFFTSRRLPPPGEKT